MSKLKNSQQGFTTIEILILVLIVAAIGVGGYLVANHRTNNKATDNSGTNQTIASTTVVKLTPLGIQITVPDAIKDITYYMNNPTSIPGGLDISTVSLSSLDAACTANSTKDNASGNALGILTSPSTKDSNTVKQIPGNGEGSQYAYIDYIKPILDCTSSSQILSTLNSYRIDFEDSLGTIQPIK
jgi:Tfp pilus assembly protein PilV